MCFGSKVPYSMAGKGRWEMVGGQRVPHCPSPHFWKRGGMREWALVRQCAGNRHRVVERETPPPPPGQQPTTVTGSPELYHHHHHHHTSTPLHHVTSSSLQKKMMMMQGVCVGKVCSAFYGVREGDREEGECKGCWRGIGGGVWCGVGWSAEASTSSTRCLLCPPPPAKLPSSPSCSLSCPLPPQPHPHTRPVFLKCFKVKGQSQKARARQEAQACARGEVGCLFSSSSGEESLF